MKLKVGYIIFIILAISALIFPFINGDKKIAYDVMVEYVHQYANKETMQEQSDKNISRYYQVKSDEYEAVVSYGPISFMNVEELTVFYEPSASKRSHLIQKAQQHLDTQIKSFEGYGEAQTQMLKEAYLEEKGEYVICIVDENVEELSKKFNKIF